MQVFLENFGSLAKTLDANLCDMCSLLHKAQEMFGEEGLSEQMNTLIQNMWHKYTTKKENETEKSKKSPSILSQDQHLFDELGFIMELDQIMKDAWDEYQRKKKEG